MDCPPTLEPVVVVSTDGGETYGTTTNSVHVDHHAMWINPRDSNHILLGCDGGLNTTYDGSKNWDFNDSLPIGQFYHVGVDTRAPLLGQWCTCLFCRESDKTGRYADCQPRPLAK